MTTDGIRLYFHRKNSSFDEAIPAFSIMRNEKYFLPHFLAHYRRLGVTNFVIYADECDSEFLGMLESEDDISILLPAERISFGTEVGRDNTGAPKRWATYLRERASNDWFRHKWHLVLDADEFLILPPMFSRVQEFVGVLDELGRTYSYAPLVDFYPRKLEARNYSRELSPFDGSQYFDAGPYHLFHRDKSFMEDRRQGIRFRMVLYLLKHHGDEIAKISAGQKIFAPTTYKFPLLKCGSNQRRNGDHKITTVEGINSGCALAHFKFYPDLDEKVMIALREGQYSRGSSEYKLIELALRKLQAMDLLSDASRRYRDASDLVAAGLIDRSDRRIFEQP